MVSVIAASSSSTILAPANAARTGLTIHNQAAVPLVLAAGRTASLSTGFVRVEPFGIWVMSGVPMKCAIFGVWLQAVSGTAHVIDEGATASILLENPGSGDHTAMIQAALDAAGELSSESFSLATVTLGPYTYNAHGLTLPEGVRLTGTGSKLVSNGAGALITVATVNGAVDNLFLSGGGVNNAALGINLASGANKVTLDRLRFDNFALQAIKTDTGSLVAVISRIFAQNCLLDAANLEGQTGVVHLDGTDHALDHAELTASRTSLSSVNAYAAALYVGGSNHYISAVQAEISDVGVYIATSSLRMVNVLADLNRGHGFVIASGDGRLTNCQALSNGRETTNTYDGFNVTAAFYGFVNCKVSSTGNSHRYGFNDLQNNSVNHNSYANCLALNCGTAPIVAVGFAGADIQALQGPPLGITAAATSWDVQSTRGWPYSNYFFQSVSPVNFTDFTNEVPGMRVSVRGDGQTTFVHNASVLRTTTGANVLAAANTFYEFISQSGVWYQL